MIGTVLVVVAVVIGVSRWVRGRARVVALMSRLGSAGREALGFLALSFTFAAEAILAVADGSGYAMLAVPLAIVTLVASLSLMRTGRRRVWQIADESQSGSIDSNTASVRNRLTTGAALLLAVVALAIFAQERNYRTLHPTSVGWAARMCELHSGLAPGHFIRSASAIQASVAAEMLQSERDSSDARFWSRKPPHEIGAICIVANRTSGSSSASDGSLACYKSAISPRAGEAAYFVDRSGVTLMAKLLEGCTG